MQTIFQIDAFASRPFEGNPAAVCPLESWLDGGLMQAIAAENNLAETAFFVPREGDYEIRWFTPTTEVALCGHATLASAWVLFRELGYPREQILFHSRSGPLRVTREGDWLMMDFPSRPAKPCELPDAIGRAFASPVRQCLRAPEDYLVVFDDESAVREAAPDTALLGTLDARGIMITARAGDYDFVSRFFAPAVGIDEDPVTGSAFSTLAPYWSSALEKPELFAKQVSRRGGEVRCALAGERVRIGGKAVKYLSGTISV